MKDLKSRNTLLGRLKNLIIGEARNPLDHSVFHNISLVAFFAWVGLGADGLSSSCYGPPEAFLALGRHHYLGIIVGLLTAITIFIIAESYSQIVELFPTGGGGYIVASKLLSPNIGMISGCALLVDYVLTITLSIASGSDALFSFLPAHWLFLKLPFAVLALIILIVLNLRGIKESVAVLMPIFMVFVVSHALIILYAIIAHFYNIPSVISGTVVDLNNTASELGIFGLLFLIMRAYSLGAGTYTGIEAVSNGLPILREPKVATAKKTMMYMVVSLSTVVLGLMIAYALYQVDLQPGKTLNAVLFERIAGEWGLFGSVFVIVTLVSEAAILFVASQAGFIDGPRVLANMAADHWVPKRFALLSDRLAALNGILIMGIGSIILMIATNGSVGYMIVLYSINVFVTFCLSQSGMVRHWWQVRQEDRRWFGRIAINGVGLMLTTFILVSVVVVKFFEGGWITLLITGSLALLMVLVKTSYDQTDQRVKEMNLIVDEVESTQPVKEIPVCKEPLFDPKNKTAVILVKDFTGVGLKTLFHIFPTFMCEFKNFVFIQVGLIDASAFKGSAELDKVKAKVEHELNRYVELLKRHGYFAEGIALYGIDTAEEIEQFVPQLLEKYPQATFFGGQIVFPRYAFISRILHNYTLIAVQKQLYQKLGVRLYLLPIDLDPRKI